MRPSFVTLCFAFALVGCSNPLGMLNPPSLVEDDQTSMAIEAFLFATEDLAQASRFGTVEFYRDQSGQMKKVVRTALLIPPDRDKVPYSRQENPTGAVEPSATGALSSDAYSSAVAWL